MSLGRKCARHLPDACWAVAFTTASFTHTAPNILGSWGVDVNYPAGSLCWIWVRKTDGTEERSKVWNLGNHNNVVIFVDWGAGDSGAGWFEARGPTGELLGKSALISIPTS
jgi:hypothetical protein